MVSFGGGFDHETGLGHSHARKPSAKGSKGDIFEVTRVAFLSSEGRSDCTRQGSKCC